MAGDPETIYTEGEQVTDFAETDWQSDVDAFFGDGGDDTPKQPDEFTASEFAAYRRMSNNGAQNKLLTLMQQGKVTRRMARGSGRLVYYYRVVKPAV